MLIFDMHCKGGIHTKVISFLAIDAYEQVYLQIRNSVSDSSASARIEKLLRRILEGLTQRYNDI